MDLIVIDATRMGAFRIGNRIFPVNSLYMEVEPKTSLEDGTAKISFYNIYSGVLVAAVRREQVVTPDGSRPFNSGGEYSDPFDELPTLLSQMFAQMGMGPGDPSQGVDAPTRQEYETFRDNIVQRVGDVEELSGSLNSQMGSLQSLRSTVNELDGWKQGTENTLNWLTTTKVPEIEGRITALEP